MNKIKQILTGNLFIMHSYLEFKNYLNNLLFNDKSFFRKEYRKTHGEYPNLTNPHTYSEKLLWSMLNYRNDIYIKCADKYEMRDFVKDKIGEEYLIKCLGIYDSIEDVNFDKLPLQFVLKATHASGWNIICDNKNNLNKKQTIAQLKYWLKHNYYNFNREWPYKYMQHRIICEEYIGQEDGTPPMDYKIFCFDGKPRLIQLDISRFQKHQRNVYDIEWNRVRGVEIAHEQDQTKEYGRPENLEKMIEISKILSDGFHHVRIDLYNVKNKIYVGEMTFFHGAGMYEYFRPKTFHLEVGSWLKLPESNINDWIKNNNNK